MIFILFMDDGFIYVILQQTIGLVAALFKEEKSKTLEDKFEISYDEYKELRGEYDRQIKEYNKIGRGFKPDFNHIVEKYKIFKAYKN